MEAKAKNKVGQPKKIPTPEDFWGLFLDYKAYVKANPFMVLDFVGKDGNPVYREKERCLTMDAFENYLEDQYGIGQIQQYLENREGRYSEYVSIVARVRREIKADMQEGGMAGVYAQNLTARLTGARDTIENKVEQSVKLLAFDPLVVEDKDKK